MKKALAAVLLVVGLVVFFFNTFFVGLLLIGIGVNLVATEGSEINLESKTYRSVKSVFGFNFGTWKPCPNFEYI